MWTYDPRYWFSALICALAPGCASAKPAGSGPLQPPESGRWVVVAHETFDDVDLGSPRWGPDPVPDDGPFSDRGRYFEERATPHVDGFRISQPLGAEGWLTAELYSRSSASPYPTMLAVTDDPDGSANKVLRLHSLAHTDGAVIRSTSPLPDHYRVSLRVGFPSFGDGGDSGTNGYDEGTESALPWYPGPATSQNGFYWLAVLDALPRPRNNVWIHHHRKVVIDSDNHFPPWMEIFNGERFVKSGAHPVMMFALDGTSTPSHIAGHDFLSWSAGRWQPSGAIRAVDAYKPRRWYRVSITRKGHSYTLRISGDFAHGGIKTYHATIDAAERCVWHYNRTPAELNPRCEDRRSFPQLGGGQPHWPGDGGWPDYFMLGDPHTNFYEGVVYYDDIVLEVWRES